MGVSSGVSHAYTADILAPYALNNLEDAATMYVGKALPDGRWLIQRFVTATGNMDYANLSNNAAATTYASAWAGRAALTYGTFQSRTGV